MAAEVEQEETVLVELAVRAVQAEEAVVDIFTFLIKGTPQTTAGQPGPRISSAAWK